MQMHNFTEEVSLKLRNMQTESQLNHPNVSPRLPRNMDTLNPFLMLGLEAAFLGFIHSPLVTLIPLDKVLFHSHYDHAVNCPFHSDNDKY